MKARDTDPHVSPFNTPAVMRARALFVLQFFALIGCLGFAEAALAEQAWRLVVPSAVCLGLMISIRLILKRTGQWQVCVDGLDRAYIRPELLPDHETESLQLLALIERRTEIEGRRGTPAFEPWALQEVRHEIIALVKAHPGLQKLLDEEDDDGR